MPQNGAINVSGLEHAKYIHQQRLIHLRLPDHHEPVHPLALHRALLTQNQVTCTVPAKIRHRQLDPLCQPFVTEVIWLYERYRYRIPKTDPLKKSHYTIHTEILDQITTLFNIKTSYFSSPVTCSLLINTYYSPFQRDSIFGSRGNAFKHKWKGNGYAHPHNKENIQKAIHWARLAAKENQDTITILTILDEEWTTNDTPYKTIFDDTHVIIHFPPDTIIYSEPTIPPN
jgi:hypothetical protein